MNHPVLKEKNKGVLMMPLKYKALCSVGFYNASVGGLKVGGLLTIFLVFSYTFSAFQIQIWEFFGSRSSPSFHSSYTLM